MSEDWIHLGGSGPVAAIIEVRADHRLDVSALEVASADGIMGLLGMLLPAGLDHLPDFVIAETDPDGRPRRALLRGAPTARLTGPDLPELVLESESLLPWRDVTIPQGYAVLTLSRPEPPPAWAASGWQMPTFFGAGSEDLAAADPHAVPQPGAEQTAGHPDDSDSVHLDPEPGATPPLDTVDEAPVPGAPAAQPDPVEDSEEHLPIRSVPVWGTEGAGAGAESAIPTADLTVDGDDRADSRNPQLPADTEPPDSARQVQPLGTVPAPRAPAPGEPTLSSAAEVVADTALPGHPDVPADSQVHEQTTFPAQTEIPAQTGRPAHTDRPEADPERRAVAGAGARAGDRGARASSDDLTLDRDAAALVGAAADSPLVLAVLCPAGHPSAAHASRCRVCEREIPGQQPFQTPRPTLGVLTMSTGDVVPVDRGILMGRAPRVNTDVAPAARPHVVRLPSPQKDISRNHVEVVLEGWHVLVRDLGSTNGTTITLPGEAPMRLRPNDPVGIEIGTVINVADEVSISFEAVR